MEMRKRHIATVAAALAVLVALSGGATWARNFPVRLDYVVSNDCVTKITVDKFFVDIDPKKHAARQSKMPAEKSTVRWTLHRTGGGGHLAGVTWTIEYENSSAGDQNACSDPITFGANHMTSCDVQKNDLVQGYWAYTIVADKGVCAAAEVDPQIIFRNGGEAFLVALLPVVVVIVLVVLAVLGFGLYWKGRRAAPPS